MKSLWLLMVLLLAGSVCGQDIDSRQDYNPMSRNNSNVPNVSFEHNNLELVRNFYPLYYQNEYRVRRDARYVQKEDSSFIALWDSVGTQVLNTISQISGIEWVERDIAVHLVKYMPTIGMYEPLAMPWEGIKTSDYVEAAPTGMRRFLNLIRLMSGRNLKQINHPECTMYYLHDHPLLEQGAYRFDNMAMAVALETAKYFFNPDTMRIIVESSSWQKSFAGWNVFESYVRYNWSISPEMPLATYLADEAYNSPLVGLTTPPRIQPVTRETASKREQYKLSAGRGRLGFSVVKAENGLLEVADVDSAKIAFVSGLMPGDRIKRVNGEVVKTAHDLMGLILDKIDADGVYMIVLREGQETGLLLIPQEDY